MKYITYNMGNRDLPDIYVLTLGPTALRLGYISKKIPLAHVITTVVWENSSVKKFC